MDNNLKERLAVWARSKRRTFLEREDGRKYLPDDCAAALQRIEELEAENARLREAAQVLRNVEALTSYAPAQVTVSEAAIIVADAIDADMFTASRIASEVGKTLENETPVSHWLSTILRALAEQECLN